MSYPAKYPFTLTRSNQCRMGATESEMYFEGVASYFCDKDTQEAWWEVEAHLTGFAQFQDGKKASGFEGMKIPAQDVVHPFGWASFEAECVERACFEYELKMTKKAA